MKLRDHSTDYLYDPRDWGAALNFDIAVMPDGSINLTKLAREVSDYDAEAIQNCYNEAAENGADLFLPKSAVVYEPLILNRSGNKDIHLPSIIGRGGKASVLVAGNGFPEGRGVIEWAEDADHGRVWSQVIKGIGFNLIHSSSNCSAIRYTGIASSNPKPDYIDERHDTIVWYQTNTLGLFELDCWITGHTHHQDVLVDIEGRCYKSDIKIVANMKGFAGDQLSFEDDTDVCVALRTTTDALDYDDSAGLIDCRRVEIHAGLYRGGMVAAFEGRLLSSKLHARVAGGGHTQPPIIVRKGVNSRISGSTEGRWEPAQILLEDCVHVDLIQTAAGLPDIKPGETTIPKNTYAGVEMLNCRGCRVVGMPRWRGHVQPHLTYHINEECVDCHVINSDFVKSELVPDMDEVFLVQGAFCSVSLFDARNNVPYKRETDGDGYWIN